MFVPLTGRALAIVEAQCGKHPEFVFTYAGRAVRQVNGKAWKKALARAGIVGFRWHDLRHTWATWNRMRGMPLQDLQALGGWQSPEMVQKYAHYFDNHLSEVVKRFSDGGLEGFAGNEKVTARAVA